MSPKSLSCMALLFVFLLTPPKNLLAQEKREATLSGTILDTEKRPFKDVRVWIVDEYSDFQVVVHADKAGYYAIQLPEGYYFVLIGTGGYIPACKSIWVLPGQTVKYSVRLSPDHENMIY